jgi:hypothetical protein
VREKPQKKKDGASNMGQEAKRSFFGTLDKMNQNDVENMGTSVIVVPNCLIELNSGKKAISFKGKMPLDSLKLKDVLTGEKVVYLVIADAKEFNKAATS